MDNGTFWGVPTVSYSVVITSCDGPQRFAGKLFGRGDRSGEILPEGGKRSSIGGSFSQKAIYTDIISLSSIFPALFTLMRIDKSQAASLPLQIRPTTSLLI